MLVAWSPKSVTTQYLSNYKSKLIKGWSPFDQLSSKWLFYNKSERTISTCSEDSEDDLELAFKGDYSQTKSKLQKTFSKNLATETHTEGKFFFSWVLLNKKIIYLILYKKKETLYFYILFTFNNTKEFNTTKISEEKKPKIVADSFTNDFAFKPQKPSKSKNINRFLNSRCASKVEFPNC